MPRERKGRETLTGILTFASITPPPVFDPAALFGRNRPLEVDLGCGKGRFLLARSQALPEVNFLGIDRYVRRLAKLNQRALAAGVHNIHLVAVDARFALEHLLPPHSVSVLYIFFPDPWTKQRHHKRRLVTPLFLDAVDRVLGPGGAIQIATDHEPYFAVIHRLLSNDRRYQPISSMLPKPEEMTDFELIARGESRVIHRCGFARLQLFPNTGA